MYSPTNVAHYLVHFEMQCDLALAESLKAVQHGHTAVISSRQHDKPLF